MLSSTLANLPESHPLRISSKFMCGQQMEMGLWTRVIFAHRLHTKSKTKTMIRATVHRHNKDYTSCRVLH